MTACGAGKLASGISGSVVFGRPVVGVVRCHALAVTFEVEIKRREIEHGRVDNHIVCVNGLF